MKIMSVTMQKIPRLAMAVVFCALLLIFSAVIFQVRKDPKAKLQPTTIVIKNDTNSVEVISSKINEANYLELTLKNNRSVPIVALEFRYAKDRGTTIEHYPDVPSVLGAGQTSIERIHLNDLSDPSNLTVILKMAYFSDGVAEGDEETIKFQRERYEGMELSFQSALGEVNKINAASDAEIETTEQNIKNIQIPEDLTPAQKGGFISGRDHAEYYLKELQEKKARKAKYNQTFNQDEELSRVKGILNRPRPGVKRAK